MKKMFIIVAACLMYAISAGLRGTYGIMLGTIASGTGIDYAAVSFTIAVGQLVFGLAQPFFGAAAIRHTRRSVLILGAGLMAAGLVAIPFCRSEWMLMLFFGIILPVGTGAVSFGMIMSAITLRLDEKLASLASGCVNASSGIGSIVFSPLLQQSFETLGLTTTMMLLALLTFVLIPASIAVCGKEPKTRSQNAASPVLPMIRNALHNRNYIFLLVGFFTCGFHMAIIETHLYSQILSFGIADSAAALAFSIYGIASMTGALLSGFLCNRVPMKHVLEVLYSARVILPFALLLLPKNLVCVIGVIVLLGLFGPATMTPTSGLVSRLFGSENLATLFGLVYVAHQAGSFLSAWLGGKCLELTGSYTLIWMIAAALSLVAACASFQIGREKRVRLSQLHLRTSDV